MNWLPRLPWVWTECFTRRKDRCRAGFWGSFLSYPSVPKTLQLLETGYAYGHLGYCGQQRPSKLSHLSSSAPQMSWTVAPPTRSLLSQPFLRCIKALPPGNRVCLRRACTSLGPRICRLGHILWRLTKTSLPFRGTRSSSHNVVQNSAYTRRVDTDLWEFYSGARLTLSSELDEPALNGCLYPCVQLATTFDYGGKCHNFNK